MPLVDTHLPHSGNNVLNQPGDVEGPVLIEKVRDVEDGQARVVETQLGQKALHDGRGFKKRQESACVAILKKEWGANRSEVPSSCELANVVLL